eukprot:CAMPEP_0179273904 /NCGR_PEP_ID=MMETSP0797-20121207/33249_1 /TAXON_ID=47934 /ORGANISM="Dinophysis acuminata, Strain DAEP01" /LENGTH=86 /DNA_ID=CAMNT_0020982337 /DNA_START=8 /DNA_END=265 /DNA_ORIENTATION=+
MAPQRPSVMNSEMSGSSCSPPSVVHAVGQRSRVAHGAHLRGAPPPPRRPYAAAFAFHFPPPLPLGFPFAAPFAAPFPLPFAGGSSS